MTDEELHHAAREIAQCLTDPDRKQLRFNDIVETAKVFYNDPLHGVRELVKSCDRRDEMYVRKQPMWGILNEQYMGVL